MVETRARLSAPTFVRVIQFVHFYSSIMSESFEPLEIIIRASPEQVWKTVSEFNHYHEWNSVVPQGEGQLKVGNILKVSLQIPGRGSSPGTCRVNEVRPLSHFVLSRKLFSSRLLYMEHAFILRQGKSNPTETQFIQTLEGSGLLWPFLRISMKRVWKVFNQMNKDLKSQVESDVLKQSFS